MKASTMENSSVNTIVDDDKDCEHISVQYLLKIIQNLHSHFSQQPEKDPFRSIYLYGSSVYEDKVSFHHQQDDHNDTEMNNDYLVIKKGNIAGGDLDILLVRDGFHHSGSKDLINVNCSNISETVEISDERNVYFEQDITLHFKLRGSMGNWYEIECHIMSTSIFMETIRQHKGITCQYVFMDLDQYVIYEDESMRWFRCFWFRNFHFHRRLLRRMIMREADVWCYSKARRLITARGVEQDFEKGKKNLVHGIRYFRFGNQILENLTISDYTVANELKKQVMSQNSTDWSYWESIFEPLYRVERDEFNKRVDKHIQDGLKVALEYNEKDGVPSKLCNIIQDYGLQYLSLNISTDIVPLAIFNRNGEELNLMKYLTCGNLIKVLISDLKLSSDDYCNGILKKVSNSLESSGGHCDDDVRGFSLLFKITQMEEMERIDETIPRQPLRETNGLIVSATISESLQLEYRVVAMPIPKVYDEFRWLNANTKNKSQSNNQNVQISDIEEIIGINKSYRGETYILYNYCGRWRWSHPNEQVEYFLKLSNVARNSKDSVSGVDENYQCCWKLLSEETIEDEWEQRLSDHKSKNFIFVKPRSQNYLSLTAVRDVENNNTYLDAEVFSPLLFNCKYSQKENIDVINEKAREMALDLLNKVPYKCSSQKEKSIVTLLRYLYYQANSLDALYDGFVVSMRLKSGMEYSVACQSLFYYNMSQLTIWHTSINIDDNVEDGKFHKFHGNIHSQSNEQLLIEMALSWLEKSWDVEVLELERTVNPQLAPFSDIYFSIKEDWKNICTMYDDFSDNLKKQIESLSSIQSNNNKEITKFISQSCDDFSLENKTIIYKIAEGNFAIRAVQVFNSPKKLIDSNSLVKIWKDYLKKKI